MNIGGQGQGAGGRGRRRSARLLGVFVPAVLLAQNNGVISGTVRSATTHLPLEGAQVSLTGEDTTAAQTDERGIFRFADLPAGSYTLHVQKAGFTGRGPVKVEAGADPVVVEMDPLGQIEGRILDEAGNPVAGVTVELLPGMPTIGEATSENDGRFLLSNLFPHDYVVRLRIPPALRKAGIPAVEYYPGVADAARAASIHVADGAQMAGFDIRLRHVPLVAFRGHVVDLSKDESARVVEVALDSEPGPIGNSYARHPVDAEGRFHFEEVPPGRHTLLVYRGSGSDDLPYAASVDVGKDDVPVTVPPFANLEGVVKFAKPASEGLLGIGLGANGAWRRNVVPDEDGTFTLLNVPPGEWSLRLESNQLQAEGRKLRVASARFGTANVMDAPMTVTEGGNPPIVITISDESGGIAGTVDQGEAKPERVVVWALPMDGSPKDNASVVAQPDGSFLIGNLLPGDYQVAALGITASRNGGAGTDCIKRLEKVTVINGQTATMKLKRCDQ